MPVNDSIHVLDQFLVPDDAIAVYHDLLEVQPSYLYDMHYALEFGIVLSGRQRRLCGDRSDIVGPGEVWFNGVWEPHGVELLETPTTVLVFAVNPQAMATVGLGQLAEYDWMPAFTAPPGTRPQAAPPVRGELLALAGRMIERIEASDEQARLWSWLCLLEMMLLVRAGWSPPSPRASAMAPHSYQRLDRAVELVLSSHRPVSLRQAARVCGLNSNAFNRLFRELMGITFAKYCLRHRLSGGAGQLARTTDTVQVIAKEWGFADASHFHRCFRTQYGCTPAQYRSRRQAPTRPTSSAGRAVLRDV